MKAKRPHFLFIMADQLSAFALPMYHHPIVRAPNLAALASRGVVFKNAYCNFPLCAPSRYSMLAGQLPSRIGAYDNAAEFPAAIPTFVHYLRALGYRTCLSGKMHFVGPDQLHGFEERLTTDIYPSDFGWTPNWDASLFQPYGGGAFGAKAVLEAGVCERSLQIDYDDDVEAQAIQRLFDYARAGNRDPFFLVVSFTHPHSPFSTTPEFWDLYADSEIDPPSVPPIPPSERDPHSRHLYHLSGFERYNVTEEHIRNARHAYYGMVSYVDAKVGRLLKTLERCRLTDDTVVIFTADHGEMLGERGMWHKYTFFEWAMRVPLLMAGPTISPRHTVTEAVSLLDIFPTLLEMVRADEAPDLVDAVDGHSLLGPIQGQPHRLPDEVRAEFLAEGTLEPRFMLRKGRYKYIYSQHDPGMMFDLEADPKELRNLSGRGDTHSRIESSMIEEIQRIWDVPKLAAEVVASQRRRRFLQEVLQKGTHTAWDFQPWRDATKQYVRRGEGSLYKKAANRFPFVSPVVDK